MSNYTQITDFSAKDALITGDPNKAIEGADLDAELAAIATAISSKANNSSMNAAENDIDDLDSRVTVLEGVVSVSVSEGTYTPTVTEISNGSDFAVSASGNGLFNYIRIGSKVMVTGLLTVTTTNSSTNPDTFRFTLPVASDITDVNDLTGTAVLFTGSKDAFDIVPVMAQIRGHVANNGAEISFYADAAKTYTLGVSFMYKVA